MTFQPTPQHELLLRGSTELPVGLYQLQLATADQLTRIHYKPGTLKTVKARLKQLTDNGYLVADSVPTRLFRSPYFYQLTDKALRYLATQGMDTQDVARPSGQHGTLFIDHSLELNDVLISAALLFKATPTCYLDSFTHEQVLKRKPYKAKLPGGRTFTIIPDGFLDFRVVLDGKRFKTPLLLEHDRGTEQQQYFRRRIRAYITLLKTGDYVTLFGSKAIGVVFTTFQGDKRIEQLRAWTRAELDLTHEATSLGQLFTFTSLERPPAPLQVWTERCWLDPYDDELQALLVS
jgi:hypothetical protein